MSLDRFIDAQDRIWPAPLNEIIRGRKSSHWMWFVFPQLKGLGTSAMAQHYSLADLEEAQAYLTHPVLGSRLCEISQALTAHAEIPARAILGPVDTLKLRSCMTLFDAVRQDRVFAQVLGTFFGGTPCEMTLEMIGTTSP